MIKLKRWLLPIGFTLLMLSGCQTNSVNSPSVSIDQAQEHRLELATGFTTPPPRTIHDIKTLFVESKLPTAPDNCEQEWQTIEDEMEVYYEMGDVGGAWMVPPIAGNELSIGNYQRAIELLKRTASLLPSSGKSVAKARVHSMLSHVYGVAGDGENAKRHKNATIGWIRRAGWSSTYRGKSYTLSAKASVASVSGNLDSAESALRKAIPMDPWSLDAFTFSKRPWLVSKLIQILLAQGRLVEAEYEARNAIRDVISDSYFSAEEAIVVAQLALVLREQGRYEDALYLVRFAIRMFEADCALPEALLLSRNQGDKNYNLDIRNRSRLILSTALGLITETATPSDSQMEISSRSETAFRITQAIRFSSVQSVISARAARSAAISDELAVLVRNEQDAEQQLKITLDTLVTLTKAPADQIDSKVMIALRDQANELKTAFVLCDTKSKAVFPVMPTWSIQSCSASSQCRHCCDPTRR